MQNGIFKLDWGSLADAVLVGVASAVFVYLFGIVTAPGFDVLAVNFATVGHAALNISIVAAFVTLGHDFLSTNTGSFLGITPGVPAASQNLG